MVSVSVMYFASLCHNPCTTSNRRTKTVSKEIQIMVVGDKNVGKSRLIDAYLKQKQDDHDSDVRIKTTALSWLCKEKSLRFDIGIRIVDVKSKNDTSSVENRKMFYDISNIIFVVYDATSNNSIDRVKSFWEAEINEAFSVYAKKKTLHDSKLVILGVNPADKSVNMTNITESLKRAEKLKSLNNTKMPKVVQRIKNKYSKRKTVVYEVREKPDEILNIFSSVIKSYLLEEFE